MTIIQNRDTVHITHALKFGLQCGVIGRVIGGLARFHRRLIGGIDPNVMAVKICQRHKASGVLAGIKGHARRVAVGVNDVAVEGGADRRGPRQHAIIKRMNVPVCVIQSSPARVQIGHDVIWHIRTRVGQAQNNWAITLKDVYRCHASNSGMSMAAAVTISPLAIMRVARSRSGAR